VVKRLSAKNLVGKLAPQNSMETVTTPRWFRAKSTAVAKSASEEEFASTRRIFARGAMAWAHSTSR